MPDGDASVLLARHEPVPILGRYRIDDRHLTADIGHGLEVVIGGASVLDRQNATGYMRLPPGKSLAQDGLEPVAGLMLLRFVSAAVVIDPRGCPEPDEAVLTDEIEEGFEAFGTDGRHDLSGFDLDDEKAFAFHAGRLIGRAARLGRRWGSACRIAFACVRVRR